MNTIYVDDAVRDKFEAWNMSKPESFYEDKNNYDLMFEAWQAATEQSRKEIAEKDARIYSLENCISDLEVYKDALQAREKVLVESLTESIERFRSLQEGLLLMNRH